MADSRLAIARCAALAALLPLLGSGCLSGVIPEPAPPPLTFDFGPLPEQRPAPLPLPFRLEDVTAPSWLRTPGIYYRRLDENPAALRPYAQNQWIATTPELFAERLSHRLAQAAPRSAVEGLPLRVEIVTFEHVYAGRGQAYVVARARVSYDGYDGRPRRQIFERRRPAAAEVRGATVELPILADNLVEGVLDWLRGETLDLEP